MNQNLTMDRYKMSLGAGQVILVVKFETFFSKLIKNSVWEAEEKEHLFQNPLTYHLLRTHCSR